MNEDDQKEQALRTDGAAWLQRHPAAQQTAIWLETATPTEQAEASFFLGSVCGLHNTHEENQQYEIEIARLARKYLPDAALDKPSQAIRDFYEAVEDEQLHRWVLDVTRDDEGEGSR